MKHKLRKFTKLKSSHQSRENEQMWPTIIWAISLNWTMLYPYVYQYALFLCVPVCFILMCTSMLYSYVYQYALFLCAPVCFILMCTSMLYSYVHQYALFLCVPVCFILMCTSMLYSYVHQYALFLCVPVCFILMCTSMQLLTVKLMSLTWTSSDDHFPNSLISGISVVAAAISSPQSSVTGAAIFKSYKSYQTYYISDIL